MHGLFDIHCHLIPYVDDGARNMNEAVRMLEMEYSQGVRYIIVTPHYRKEMFETPMEKILTHFLELRNVGRKMGIQLFLGCEYHVEPEIIRNLKEKERPCMASSRYVLTEFRYGTDKDQVNKYLDILLMNGYLPIVAHVERYPQVCQNWDFLEEIVQKGAFLQVNAGSILGDNGSKIKRFCRKLMKRDLLHYVGSDAHRTDVRRPILGPCADYVVRKMGKDYAEKIFIENPKQIVMRR